MLLYSSRSGHRALIVTRHPSRNTQPPPPPPPTTHPADTTYAGGVTWAGTGIQFSSDAAVVKGAIALLKQRNPRTKASADGVCVCGWVGLLRVGMGGCYVRRACGISSLHPANPTPPCLAAPSLPQVLVAVGGATYNGWDALNMPAIVKFVETFGLDGVDIDYEVRRRSVCVFMGGREGWRTCRELVGTRHLLPLPTPNPASCLIVNHSSSPPPRAARLLRLQLERCVSEVCH